MFFRSEKLLIPLQKPASPDPNGAAAIQELLGGKFGELSTLNNYLHQSFGFKEKKRLKPFYDLIASITAEELGHVELITTAINLMLEGSVPEGNLSMPRSRRPKISAIRTKLMSAAAVTRLWTR